MRECCGGPKTVRSMSAPKILIPSEVMGEYEDPEVEERPRRKSAPALPSRPPGGGLYPLTEEGTYGPPPIWNKMETYKKRERKPKVYASYAISNDCNVHAEKLEKNEKSHHQNLRKLSAPSPRNLYSPLQRSLSVSGSSYSPSVRSDRRSVSLSPERPQSRLSFNSDTSGYESTLTYESTQYIKDGTPKTTAPDGKRCLRRVSSGKGKKRLEFPEVVCEEEEETGSSVYSSLSLSSGSDQSSWDSMGILGLSSKLFSERQTKQETILNKDFMRRISVGTHVC